MFTLKLVNTSYHDAATSTSCVAKLATEAAVPASPLVLEWTVQQRASWHGDARWRRICDILLCAPATSSATAPRGLGAVDRLGSDMLANESVRDLAAHAD